MNWRAIRLILTCAIAPGAARADALPSLLVWSEGPSAEDLAHALGEAAGDCGSYELVSGAGLLQPAAGLPSSLVRRFAAGLFDLRTDEEVEAIVRAAGAQFLLVVGASAPDAAPPGLRARLFERSRGLVLERRVSADQTPDAFWAVVGQRRRVRRTPRCGEHGRPACGPAWYWAAAGVVVLGVVLAGLAVGAQDDGAWARFPRR